MYKDITVDQTSNPYGNIVSNQKIVEIPQYELECGEILYKFPVAYKTWGQLNAAGDNCMVICHALTGSADVSDWWGPLLGKDKAFDPTKFFIICLNSLGSPYGSASPVTINPASGQMYGPEFPLATVKDDVGIHKMVLDSLGVKQIAACIGGSMGGMLVLEYAFLGPEYVRCVVPLATSAIHSAWCISWNEAQRQCIYSDPKYEDGYYELNDQPVAGLSAARMAALLTYRSRNSFEARFGRKLPDNNTHSSLRAAQTQEEENWLLHNEGLNGKKSRRHSNQTLPEENQLTRTQSNDSISSTSSRSRPQTYFTAQSYLRYQGTKFISRFDSNCYISITRKLDTHDVCRNRDFVSIPAALQSLVQPALVIGIQSDGLFTYSEQQLIAKEMPNAKLARIDSPEGHDAFLLEFAQIDQLIMDFLHANLSDIYEKESFDWNENIKEVKNSVFGEAEDVSNW